MANCVQCGTPIPEGSYACPHCGSPVQYAGQNGAFPVTQEVGRLSYEVQHP